MRCAAILLAAGKSERFGRDKLSLPLAGRPIWRWSYDALRACPEVDAIGVVCREGGQDTFREVASEVLFLVEGGATRTESVRHGLEHVPAEFNVILVHDAARPLASSEAIGTVAHAAEKSGAACTALPVVDTIKEACADGFRTLDRNRLFAVQTPQGARRDLLLQAYEKGSEATDDLALLEATGVQPVLLPGERRNLKITTEEDYMLAQALVNSREITEVRTGLGYDVHAFSTDPARPMWLGGLKFEGVGLEGHSDADVLLHAVVDALLGAANLGDIGLRYPNTDPMWKNASSMIFLRETAVLLIESGWKVTHVDATVLAERPKLMSRRNEICASIAAGLGVGPTCVSVKATTHEGLGAIGRGEGVAAMAVATLARIQGAD